MEHDHPNIVRVVGFGDQDGEPLLLAEHVDGVSCDQMLTLSREQKEPLPVPVALEIACEILEALAYTHDLARADGAPLVPLHGNVCPGNIFISAMGEVKLADFGILLPPHGPGVPDGKPGYMSPEQIAGRELDGRSDLFSLGVVVFEMLTGTPLFAGTDDSQRPGCARQTTLSPLSDVRFSSLPFELRLVLATALASDRTERFQDAREFSVAFRAFARHAGISVERRALVEWLRRLDIVPMASGTYLVIPAVSPTGDELAS
jgi:serine/threonine protein kinase